MKNIEKYVVLPEMTLLEALQKMDALRVKSLFIMKNDSFHGLLTIGDLQRAIIAKRPFESPVIDLIDNAKKSYAKEGDSIDDIKEYMLKYRAEYMPVLDERGNLKEVLSWGELFPGKNIERRPLHIPVVIMAGGKGTRLKPITNVLPKPLIPMGDKTMAEEIMDRFIRIGCDRFYMSVNYKSNVIRFYLNQFREKYNIEFFEEAQPLGTIGSVSLLKGKFNTPFFVTNCDNLIDRDFRDVYEYHVDNHNELTIVTAVKSIKIPYGVIETGEDGLLTGIREKPETTYMINTGVYILNPELMNEIPDNQFFHVTDLMAKIKARGGRIGCFPVGEKAWQDMGEWPEYLKMIHVL